MINKFFAIACVMGASFSYGSQAHARQDFLAAWKRIYPESASSERECQLCHQRIEGGDGWNSYGIAIRFALRDIFGGFDIDAAIVEIELENADLDSDGLTNLQEIELGLDPGWVVGNNNEIVFKDSQILLNQPAPFADVDGAMVSPEPLCLAIKPKNSKTVMICL